MTVTKQLPKAACVLCIHPDTGHILAATRRYTTNQWGLIGGKVDDGELPIDAASREFAEETGIIFDVPPQYLTTMEDSTGYLVSVYFVPPFQARVVADQLHGKGIYSVEPDILVGFIPMIELCIHGPFTTFNSKLLSFMLANMVKELQ